MWPAKNPLVNRANTLIIIGDSITAANYSTSGISTYYTSKGMWTQALIKLGQRLKLIANMGIGGQKSTTIAARFCADVINNAAGRPGYVGILAGTNDATTDDTIGSLKSMYEAARAAGIVVIAQTIMPKLFTGYASSQTLLQHFLDVNNWMRWYASNNPGIILVDYYGAMLDVSSLAHSAAGDPISTYMEDYGTIGTHPNPTGARVMGDLLFAALDPFVPKVPLVVTANRSAAAVGTGTGDASNYVLNGLFFGATLATNWTSAVSAGTISGTNSKVTRTDGVVGEWQRISLSGATAISDVWQLKQAMTNSTIGLAVGDTIYAEVEVNAARSSGVIQTLALYVDSTTSGFVGLSRSWSNAGTNDLNTASLTGVLRTPPMVIPATGFYTNFVINMGTSVGGAADCDFARARIVKV